MDDHRCNSDSLPKQDDSRGAMEARENSEWQSYDPKFFAKIASVEDKHFWFCARNRIIAAVGRIAVGGLPAGYRLLDIGCGTGTVLRQLTQVFRDGEVTGMDLYPEAAALASQRARCRVVVGDILNPPDLGHFHIITMFDVLEHFPDDQQVLAAANRMLKDGGTLILTVPAHMLLWSYFDVAAHHRRRYNSGELTRLLHQSGFEVEYVTEFMMSLFPLLWLRRRVNCGRKKLNRESATERAESELKIVPVINAILKLTLSIEAFAIRRRWHLPVGTSLLAVARKRPFQH